ncbi:MAG: YbaN family protein [Gammaproteobacteria bacterium]|nr:YbaN family protein [Gammaproteobacteria bacterium]MCF6229628.1 YbaN family protein [Gammaproteobacteria bacterium]
MKWFYLSLGLLFLALALVGVLLPGLPTTPFILLAAGCFAKSSSRLYNGLLGNRLFGPMIRDWEAHRAISRRVRNIAMASMLFMGGVSIFFILDQLFIQLLVAAMVFIGSYVVMRIRLTELRAD